MELSALEQSRLAVVGLERDHCCVHDLSWRCDLDGADAVHHVAQRLREHGYAYREVTSGGLIELRHPQRHTIVLVASTGRVQIRLDRLTPSEQREALAIALALEVATAAAAP